MTAPLFFFWEGDAFRPIPRHAKECDKRFVIGQSYCLDEIHDRLPRSHRHFFAAVHEGWMNLPETISGDFPTAEHLRKHALIRSGFHDKRSLVASSKAEALRLAAFVEPMDEYAIVTILGSMVEVYTAKSQSNRAMERGEFQKSKIAVLEWIGALIGVEPKRLEKEGMDR